MKENRFRGKCAHCDAWAYGSLVDYGEDETPEICGFDPFREGEEEWREIAVDRWTVGQYINRKDKKDNDIYDGDIIYVEFGDGSHSYELIGWNEEKMCWGCMNRYDYESIADGYDFAEFKGYVLNAYFKEALICEVVGNIHDNQELMQIHKS